MNELTANMKTEEAIKEMSIKLLITQMLFDFLLIRIGENSKQNILS